MIKFKKEMGMVISEESDVLSIVEGTTGSVEFDSEFILDVHKRRPGYIYKLVHTHPSGMAKLSGRDKQTLKTLAFSLYPFPVRMSTVTLISDDIFTETEYLALLESKETWIQKGKGERKFEIIKDHEWDFIDPVSNWMKILIERSYEHIK